MIWRIIFSGSSARSSRSVTLAAMISRVREKIPILLTPVEILETLKNAGAGAGQGGRVPRHQSRSGQRTDRRGRCSGHRQDADGMSGAEGDLRLVDHADEAGRP